VDVYGRLLETGGGKERMHVWFSEQSDREPYASVTDAAERTALLKQLHLSKTRIFQDMIQGGELALRPGVKALIGARKGLKGLRWSEGG